MVTASLLLLHGFFLGIQTLACIYVWWEPYPLSLQFQVLSHFYRLQSPRKISKPPILGTFPFPRCSCVLPCIHEDTSVTGGSLVWRQPAKHGLPGESLLQCPAGSVLTRLLPQSGLRPASQDAVAALPQAPSLPSFFLWPKTSTAGSAQSGEKLMAEGNLLAVNSGYFLFLDWLIFILCVDVSPACR